MHPVEIQHALNGMVCLVDSREQDTQRLRERLRRIGLPHERCKLDFGDYSARCDALDLSGLVAIERKMSAAELAQCFTKGRERFTREFERARAAGARLYLLIENSSLGDIYKHKYRSLMEPKAFAASLFAWMARYDCRVVFCGDQDAGQTIREILYREMKERLEREADC